MNKSLFVTGTNTDIGKTYICGLIQKKLIENNINAGYYKAAMSGSINISSSDAAYVKEISNSNQNLNKMVSYIFSEALSPHLAAKLNNQSIELSKIAEDYNSIADNYDYVTVEGSGGIICPIRDDDKLILLEDIIKLLNLNVIIIADSNLGTINSTVLTSSYLKSHQITCKGIIMNNYSDSILHKDNAYMIEKLTNLPILAKIANNSTTIGITLEELLKLYD